MMMIIPMGLPVEENPRGAVEAPQCVREKGPDGLSLSEGQQPSLQGHQGHQGYHRYHIRDIKDVKDIGDMKDIRGMKDIEDDQPYKDFKAINAKGNN